MKLTRKAIPYLLLLPVLVVIAGVIIYPLVYVIHLSLLDFNLLRMTKEFVGIRNYGNTLTDAVFWNSVRATLYYTGGSVALSFALGLGMALLLNLKFRWISVARLVVFLSWATPWLAACLIWYNMLSPQVGPINEVLIRLGVIKSRVVWLYRVSTAMPGVILATAWKLFPIPTLLILAGLQNISPQLYEAASMDGASKFQEFRYITLPNLATVNSIAITILIIWSFKLFTIVFVLTHGGPGRSTQTLSILAYERAFEFYRLGSGSTVAVLMVVVSCILVVVYFKLIHMGKER